MLNLVCGSLERHLDGRGYSPAQRREGARGVMVTALRGFALVPLLAPTSVAVAILTRELPGLSWSALLPFGLLCAAILLVVGWTIDNHRLHQQDGQRTAARAQPVSWLAMAASLCADRPAGQPDLALSDPGSDAAGAARRDRPATAPGGSPTAVYGEVRGHPRRNA